MKKYFIFSLFILWQSFVQALPIQFSGFDILADKKIEFSKRPDSKGLVVLFLSSSCPCSNSHVELIKKYKVQFSDFDFLVMHSNQNESVAQAKIYFAASLPGFTVIQDENARWADEFKAFKTPHVFVLNQKGDLLYQGGITNSAQAAKSDRKYLQEVLEDITSNKSPRLSEGRTLGCMIQREKDE